MKIEQYIAKEFRGCCLMKQDGKVLASYASGFCDLANEVPNTLTTKFATASAGKVFVAVAILQLIEKGILHFEDTLGKLLDIALNLIDPKVTVEQLLTHTSGVPDYFDESVMEEYEELWTEYPNYKIRTNGDLLPLFINKPMLYPRGERFQYNNTGFVLLAMILEKLTAMPFDAYLKDNVFTPCGMDNTGYYELDRLPAGCAHNYIYNEPKQEYRTNIYSVDVKGTGAGGAFTTVGDIAKFWEGLLSHKLLSPQMTENMLTCHSGSEEDGYYGYGIWLRKDQNGVFAPYFQGSDPGVSFLSSHNFSSNLTVTSVSNYCDNVWKIMRNINDRLKEGNNL